MSANAHYSRTVVAACQNLGQSWRAREEAYDRKKKSHSCPIERSPRLDSWLVMSMRTIIRQHSCRWWYFVPVDTNRPHIWSTMVAVMIMPAMRCYERLLANVIRIFGEDRCNWYYLRFVTAGHGVTWHLSCHLNTPIPQWFNIISCCTVMMWCTFLLLTRPRRLLGNEDDGGRNSVNNDRCIEYPYGSNGAGLSVSDQSHVLEISNTYWKWPWIYRTRGLNQISCMYKWK